MEENSLAEGPRQERFQEELKAMMARYQAADIEAAGQLVNAVSPLLSRFFRGLPDAAAHWEDLLQECWLRIHRARHSYRPGEPVLPWIFAIARHTRVDVYRRHRRSTAREVALDDALGTHPAGSRQQAAPVPELPALLRLLDKLPESQREVLVMLKVTGMSAEEVARATSSTAAAVKQKAYRACQNLRRWLGARTRRKQEEDEVRRP